MTFTAPAVDVATLRADRDSIARQLRSIVETAQRSGHKSLTTEETARFDALLAQRNQLDTQITAPAAGAGAARSTASAYDQVARVGSEPRTYTRESDRKGSLFLRDVARQFLTRDPDAIDRLARHMSEEKVERGQQLQRAAGTGAFSGLVVPQYLTDMYAPAVANMRPFADICNHHDLPSEGMTVNISRITTASSVALQASENSAVSETDMDDTLLTENVQTASGQQTLSRQAIERGTGIEEVTLGDLFRRYATTLDNTLINQSTTGLAALATTTTYTDASPTVGELYPKLLGAAAGVEAALLGQAVPSHVIMHSRRWYWMQSQVGPNWPTIQQPGIDPQSSGVNNAVKYGSGSRGVLPNGMQAVVDNNLGTAGGTGTNEDAIYVVPADECHLWEDPNAPVYIRADQPKAASLGVLLVLYGYFAYSFRRFPAGMQSITGSGLSTPAF
ncbi:hypothetical protein [Amycolatopsis sp. NBC_00438]|uniref:hypothetical protein n=1 Tax=Amycolatopsis sp. NBC_00438 TaxID=2903558 RepID=UPI002E2171F2